MQSLESQFYAFMVTVVMGLTIGMMYDFYKVTKGILRPGKVASCLSDIFFWLLCTLLVFFMLLIGNWGEIRLYVALGVATGILAYIRLLSRRVTKVLQRAFFLIKSIVKYIGKALGFLWFGITYPLIVAKNIIVIPVGYLGTVYTRMTKLVRLLARRFVAEPAAGSARRIRTGIKRRIHALFKNK